MNKFTGIIKSLQQLIRLLICSHQIEVIFYYPQLFNRSKEGTNPYFKLLIELCKKHNINYVVLEEPAFECGFTRDSHSVYADAIYWFVWLMHRIMIGGFHISLHEADKKTGRIVDFITCHRLRAKTYITISNSMIDVLGEINPNGNVYDLQHGIIYYGHLGYFLNKDQLRPEFLIGNRRVLLWGELYKRNLKNLPCEIDSDDKFIVVGYPLYKRIEVGEPCPANRALVSMQFTADLGSEVNATMLQMLKEFVDEACAQGYDVLLKHHPRFNNEVDLQPLINRFNGKVKTTSEPLDQLARKVKLHVTWGSTTALEYAAYGVPTYFLRDERFDWATEIFYGQYSYPLFDGISSRELFERIDDASKYEEDRVEVKRWYESAYSPLNEALLLKILKGDYNEKK